MPRISLSKVDSAILGKACKTSFEGIRMITTPPAMSHRGACRTAAARQPAIPGVARERGRHPAAIASPSHALRRVCGVMRP